MSIHWDTRNKRWRYEFDRVLEGRRHRLKRLLPKGWSQAQADSYDRKESARLYAVASGIERTDPLIDRAVVLYLRDKAGIKSHKETEQHLAAIRWAYEGKTMSELPEVARLVSENRVVPAEQGGRGEHTISAATVRNRLACLKAACRWAWRAHGIVDSDPTARMQLPSVSNERQVYITRRDMLRLCRACTHWESQIAIRAAFYTGMRLGELYRVEVDGASLVLHDTKNGDRRAIPAHPKIRHLLDRLPLTAPMITIQRAFQRARRAVGLEHVHFHDLRHSSASEMVNAGVPLHTIGKVLGHRDARSTQRYAHLTTDTLAAAVATIGARKRA